MLVALGPSVTRSIDYLLAIRPAVSTQLVTILTDCQGGLLIYKM